MSVGGPVATKELVDVQTNLRVAVYLRRLWDRRSYALYVARSELRQRQVTTVFGSLWNLLNPVLSIAVYFVVFGLVLDTHQGVGGTSEFLVFLTVGLFVFQFTQRAVTQASTSIVANRGLVQAIRFPRALLPLSATLTEGLAAIPTFVVALAVALIAGDPPTWRWLVVPLILAWQTLFNLGMAMVAARATTHLRDMQQLLPFFFRLLIYGSGVFFSVEAYVSGRALDLIILLNPVYAFVTIGRWAIMSDPVEASVVASAVGWTILSVVGGFLWFRAAEHTYDHV